MKGKTIGLVLGAAVAFGLPAGAAQAEALKIGIIESLSGPQTSTGRLFAAAAKFVVDEINKMVASMVRQLRSSNTTMRAEQQARPTSSNRPLRMASTSFFKAPHPQSPGKLRKTCASTTSVILEKR